MVGQVLFSCIKANINDQIAFIIRYGDDQITLVKFTKLLSMYLYMCIMLQVLFKVQTLYLMHTCHVYHDNENLRINFWITPSFKKFSSQHGIWTQVPKVKIMIYTDALDCSAIICYTLFLNWKFSYFGIFQLYSVFYNITSTKNSWKALKLRKFYHQL